MVGRPIADAPILNLCLCAGELEEPMDKKRFIAAFSPDASEVATEVSWSSSAGPIRRRRSPYLPTAVPLRRFEDFPVLPRTRQPMKSYLGVRQRRWGT